MGHASVVNESVRPVVVELSERLGANLHSCILYGSSVRGEHVAGQSDVNLLIVLNEATPEAHSGIAEAIRCEQQVEPFVLGLRGLERSQRVFALKFRSIQRHYQVLHGVDVLADFSPDDELIRFLCEQSLRNLRLRLKHAYITFGHDRGRYSRFVYRTLAGLRVALSETVRCEGIEVPSGTLQRIPLFERVFGVDAGILKILVDMRAESKTMLADEICSCHARLFTLLTHAVNWIEIRWPTINPTSLK